MIYTLCFLTRANQVLMLHRRYPPNQGLWNGVGGHIEAGEIPLASCLREVREETGCEARIVSFAGVAYYVPRRSPKVVLYWNMALVREGPLDAPDEVDELVWLTPAAALEKLDHESDREILEEALHLHHSPGEREPRERTRLAPLSWAAGAGLIGLLALAALRLGPAGMGWLLAGAAACGGLAGAAVSLLVAGTRRG